MKYLSLNRFQFSCIVSHFLLLFIFASLSLPANAQEKGSDDSIHDLASRKKEIVQTELFQIIQKSSAIDEALDKLNKSIPTRDTLERIAQLQIELDRLNNSFEVRSTQLSDQDILSQNKSRDSWLLKLQDLTKPLINILHRLSEKPRKIDQLQEKIRQLERKIEVSEQANKTIDEIAQVRGPLTLTNSNQLNEFQERLKNLKIKYNAKILELELETAHQELSLLEGDKKTLVDITSEFLRNFFSVRGKNILFAFGAFIGLWWILNRIGKLLDQRSPFGKAVKTAYGFLTMAACISSSVLVLYLRNDWLLLSVVSLILLAVFWTSRQIIPEFFHELKMVMNLGPVKEGERIIWNGIPWLVKEIGMYTTLENINLENGTISIPVSYLVEEYSRPVAKDEYWFPTQKGNWVFLSDKTYGMVLSQTMEQVVVLSDGSKKFYPTHEFLNLKPINLSTGFNLLVEFELGHDSQSKISNKIPQLFETEMQKQFKDRLEKVPPDFHEVNVRFSEINASSLNLMVNVKVNGRLANNYFLFKGEINSALVRICNENEFAIPSNRLTIDFPDSAKL